MMPRLSKNKSFWFGAGSSSKENILSSKEIEDAQRRLGQRGRGLVATGTTKKDSSGLPSTVDEEIERAVSKLGIKTTRYDVVIVGSYRWGTQKRGSDVDLLVLIDQKDLTKLAATVRGRGGTSFDVTVESVDTFVSNLNEMKPFEVFCVVHQPQDLKRAKNYLFLDDIRKRCRLDKHRLARNVLESADKDRERMRKSEDRRDGVQYCKSLLAMCRLLDVTCQLVDTGNLKAVSFRGSKRLASLPRYVSYHDKETVQRYLRCAEAMCAALRRCAESDL